MGNEVSSELIDDSVEPQTLKSRDLHSVAQLIKDGKVKKVVVMTGAGISTSAGIPDFRSPETGLYANLARLDLPFAEAVFDISFFRNNPQPFYTLARELYPGQYKPTITHSFIALLHKKGLLRMHFTQNIDCLDRAAGLPLDKTVAAHGSFATQRCIDCKTEYLDDLMEQNVRAGTVPHCQVPQCNGLVKPDITFFGEALPERFHENRGVPSEADLVIIMGTSLTVQPFASLPVYVENGVPRLLINLERVGGLGSRSDDVCLLKNCDDGVVDLATELGWDRELREMWQSTAKHAKEAKAKDDHNDMKAQLHDEVAQLTRDMDRALQMCDKPLPESEVSDAKDDNGRMKSNTPNAKIAETTNHDRHTRHDDAQAHATTPDKRSISTSAGSVITTDVSDSQSAAADEPVTSNDAKKQAGVNGHDLHL